MRWDGYEKYYNAPSYNHRNPSPRTSLDGFCELFLYLLIREQFEKLLDLCYPREANCKTCAYCPIWRGKIHPPCSVNSSSYCTSPNQIKVLLRWVFSQNIHIQFHFGQRWNEYFGRILMLRLIPCNCPQNMAAQLANDLCCTKHCWGVDELWISIRVNDWTAKRAITASNVSGSIQTDFFLNYCDSHKLGCTVPYGRLQLGSRIPIFAILVQTHIWINRNRNSWEKSQSEWTINVKTIIK